MHRGRRGLHAVLAYGKGSHELVDYLACDMAGRDYVSHARRLDFDLQTERFLGCEEANQLLTKDDRQPFGLRDVAKELFQSPEA